MPLMEWAECGNQDLNGICVSGRSLELLMEIKKLLDVFAPSGDDYRHSLWIEVPRGKPSDWCSFNHAKDWAEEEVYSRADYLKEWKSNYPMASQWYHIAVTQYRGHTYLHMVGMTIGGARFTTMTTNMCIFGIWSGCWNRRRSFCGRRCRCWLAMCCPRGVLFYVKIGRARCK